MKEYRPRNLDDIIRRKMRAMGAVHIVGPKWCGKTTTAKTIAKTVISFEDPAVKQGYIELAEINPSRLLSKEKPILIDEWQSVPSIWDSVRHEVDEIGEKGMFILTGSVNINWTEVEHTGTGRISEVMMRTMSSFESGDSDGSVRLEGLFDGNRDIHGESGLTLEDVARLIVRGGWPEAIGVDEVVSHDMLEGYCLNLEKKDISSVDGVFRDPDKAHALLRSLSRNVSTSVSKRTICEDVNGSGVSMSSGTLDDYLKALRGLYILEELRAWEPRMKSKAVMRTRPAIQFADPAIPAYYLNASVDKILDEPRTFGLLFESLVVRDLRVYADSLGGKVFRYHDSNELEVDAVIQLRDGRWGAIEIKTNRLRVDEASVNLRKLSSLADMGEPSFLAVIVPTGQAYMRKDGVAVIPIGCLRD